MIRIPEFNRLRPSLLPLVAIAFTGCASLGSLEDILADTGGLFGDQVTGEIRQIDTRRREIEVESGWGGAERVRYDSRTEVYYRQRRYDVRDLERGDYVRIRLDDDYDRDRYATVIEVEESRRAGRDDEGYGRRERIEGRVEEVDSRRGWFELRDSRGGSILVTLPYDPNRSLRDRFQRLRRGDRIRIEGERLNRNRVEILRFL